MIKVMNSLSKKKKGILFILMAAFSFSLMTFFVRFSGDVPTMEKCFFRNLPTVFISGWLLARSPQKFHIKRESYGGILMRCVFGASGMIANFWAIDHLALPDANLLNKISPFFAMILSAWLLKEKPTRAEWGLVFTAFAGALLVIKPTAGAASLPALVGLFSGFGAGTAYTFVHKLGLQGERGQVIVFCFSLFTVLLCSPYLIFSMHPLTPFQLGALMCAGFAGAGGQLAITAAYQAAPAKEISVFDYTQVIFSAVWGFFFLDELPDRWSVLGYIIIGAVAVVKWRLANRPGGPAEAAAGE